MNQEAIHYTMQWMSGWLDNRQMVVLQNTLDESVKLTRDQETEKTTAELLDAFIATKRLEGRSNRHHAALRYGQTEQRKDVA